MKTIEIIIYGRVQGVWFRKYTKIKALESGVMGMVKNLPNVTVQSVVQGEDHILEAFVEWCNIGSPKSKVERIEVSKIESEMEYESFEIKH